MTGPAPGQPGGAARSAFASSRLVWWAGLVWLAGVLALTLHPTDAGRDLDGFEWRGLGDAARNLALFLPLGVGLALRSRGATPAAMARASLLGASLSVLVEALQAGLVGRDPALADVVANSLGAGLGAALPPVVRARCRGRLNDVRGDVAGALALLGAVALQIHAISPGRASPVGAPAGVFVHLDHRLEYVAPAAGRAEVLSLAGRPREQGWALDVSPDEVAPLGGPPVRVRYAPAGADAGGAPEVRSIVIVSDRELETLLFVGRRDDALIVQHATLAGPWGFGGLQGVWSGRLVAAAQAPVEIGIEGAKGGYCVALDRGPAAHGVERSCALGLGLADAWSLAAARPLLLTPGLRAVLGLGWLGVLFAGAGAWFGVSRRSAWLGLCAVVGCLWLQVRTDVRAASLLEGATVAGAWALGVWAGLSGSGRRDRGAT